MPIDEQTWEYFHRIWKYAHSLTAADKDRAFLNSWTLNDSDILKLAKALANYNDVFWKSAPKRREGGYYYIKNVWGSFKGVSTKLLRLQDGQSIGKQRSTDRQIEEARQLVMKNPRPYRMALNQVQKAESRANELQFGAQNEASWIELEEMDDAIEADFAQFKQEEEAIAKPVDWKKNADEVQKKLDDANADLKKNMIESGATVTSLRSQLSEANNKQGELTKELARLEKEYEEAKAKIQSLKSDVNTAKKDATIEKNLNKTIEELRTRSNEYRSKLTEANNEVRRLNQGKEALQRKIDAMNAKQERDHLIDKILRAAKFDSATTDASFEDSMGWISSLFAKVDRTDLYNERSALLAERSRRKNSGSDLGDVDSRLEAVRRKIKSSEIKNIPLQLHIYLDDMFYKADNRSSAWTLEELDALYRATMLLRRDAQMMLDRKVLDRKESNNRKAYDYYKQIYGVPGATLEEAEMSTLTLVEDMKATQEEHQLNSIANGVNALYLSLAKMQRLARILDGHTEGIIYDHMVRQSWLSQSKEKEWVNRRMQQANEVYKRLGLSPSQLNREGYTYTKADGKTQVKLTRGQMIGVYVYSKSQLGIEKLSHIRGNGIVMMNLRPKAGESGIAQDLSMIVTSLTKEEREWGDYLLKDMGAQYERLRLTYYEIYNQNLGQRDNYFPFVAQGNLVEGEADLLCGPTRDQKRYTDKGFTKQVNPYAIYPLDLDVTVNWAKQVARQEHFIAYAAWARDSQYLVGPYGGIGDIVKHRFGDNAYRELQEYVNFVGSPQNIQDNIDRIMGRMLSSYSAAVLIGNIATALKQGPSLASSLRGDIDMRSYIKAHFGRNINMQAFLQANKDLDPNGDSYETAKAFIFANAPEMQNRSIDMGLESYFSQANRSAIGGAITKMNNTIAKYTMNLIDGVVVNQLWLGAYYTKFNELKDEASKNGVRFDMKKAHDEARFKASQLISETQPTMSRMDQNHLQRKAQSNQFFRILMMFSNQIMNIYNQEFFDLPHFFKTKDYRKAIGTIANIAIGAIVMLVIGGAFVPKGDEDDDEYKKRLAKELKKQALLYAIPVVGNNIAGGVDGYGGGLVTVFDTAGKAIRGQKDNEDFWDAFIRIGSMSLEELAKLGGLPVNGTKRIVKAIKEGNPGYLLNATWGEIMED